MSLSSLSLSSLSSSPSAPRFARALAAGLSARSAFGSLVLFLSCAASQQASATVLYWDGNSTTAGAGNTTALLNREWGTFAAWNSDAAGVTDTFTAVTTAVDDLFFVAAPSTSSGNVAFNPTVSGTQVANSITFQQAGAATLSGGTSITLSSATALNFANGTGANIVSAPLVLGASTAFTNSDNSLQTISGGVTGNFDLTLKGESIGGLTLSTGSVNHQGAITNTGAGTNTTTISAVIGASVTGVTQNSATSLLVVSGANTSYAGPTTLTTGTLRGANTATTNVLNAFGTSSLALNGGTLQLRANGSASSQTIVAGNAVTIGSNPVTIDVNNNGANNSSAITLGNLTLGTGTLNVTGGNTYRLAFTGANHTLTGNATFNPTTANVSVSGVIADGGSGFGITKTGTGTLTLSGANSYSGSISILEGALTVGASSPSGADSPLGNSTSPILLGNTSGSANASLLENGTFTVGRDIIVRSGNTGIASIGSTAQGNGSSTYSGSITLGSGGVARGVTLTGNNFHTTTYSGVIQDPSDLVGTGGTLTVAAGTSSSTITLSNANTFTGGVVLNSGTIRMANLQALGLGTLTIMGGGLSQSVAGVVAGLTSQTWAGNFSFSVTAGAINLGTSPVTLVGARSVGVDNGPVTVGGVITGGGSSLRFNGTAFSSSVTLNGTNTFDGGLTVAAGTANLTLASGNASAFGTGQVRLTAAAGSRLSLNANTTVDSLTTGIVPTTTIVGGTGGTNGTYPLVFTGGGGTGAAGTATITGGAITSVSITDLGTNYTSAPTITLSGGDGTGTVTTTGFASSTVNLSPSVARELTIAGTNANPATFAGAIVGAGGSLVKNGDGTQILAGTNTYSGFTTVNQGKLVVSGAISGTTAVFINGGSLELGAANSVNDAASLTMSGGTFNTAGFAETVGFFALNGPATIDLGSGASTLNIADSSVQSWFGTLSISGWSGSITGGGTDQILFGTSASGLTQDQVALISFINPEGLPTGTYSASILPTGELVAVPEPASVVSLLGGLGTLLGFRRSRRRTAI